MANITMTAKVLHVSKTTAQWAVETAVAPKGMLLIEFTEEGMANLKVGDGVNNFNSLPYASAGNVDLSDYYTSSEMDAAISAAISAIGNVITIKGVVGTAEDLPSEDNVQGDVWFVNETDSSYAEYIWVVADETGAWELLGHQQAVDLSDYATTEYVDDEIGAVASSVSAAVTRIGTLETTVSGIASDYVSSSDTLVLNCTI